MSFRNFLTHDELNDAGSSDPLVASSDERPRRSDDVALDRRLLPEIEKGAEWSELLQTTSAEKSLPDDGVLRWLSDALHYQIVETDPNNARRWRLTKAGKQRLHELSSDKTLST